jgi:hypothetical protein
MRFVMFVFWALSLWFVYRIGRTLFSFRIAIWGILCTAFYPEFIFTSTEFRTDDLWMTLWFAALSVALGGWPSRKRAFFTGLLLGAAFTVTVKTGLMIGAVSLAAISVVLWQWKWGEAVDWKSGLQIAGAALVGITILPSVAAAYFFSRGAFQPFFYCNVAHNLIPHAQNWQRLDVHVAWLPMGLIGAASWMIKLRPQRWTATVLQRAFIGLIAVYYFTALKTLFPTLSRQDDLPVIPLAAMFVVAAIHALVAREPAPATRRNAMAVLLPVIVLVELFAAIKLVPPFQNKTREEIAILSDTLRISTPSDLVMDAVGETIYRNRPYYYALEAFTRVRIERGMIPNDIEDYLALTGTAVVRPRSLPHKTRMFVRENYVNIDGDLCVLGRILTHKHHRKHSLPMEFTLAVPGRFVVIDTDGKMLRGELDGTAFDGSCAISAGSHSLVVNDEGTDRLAVFWADAFERGFSPFKDE